MTILAQDFLNFNPVKLMDQVRMVCNFEGKEMYCRVPAALDHCGEAVRVGGVSVT